MSTTAKVERPMGYYDCDSCKQTMGVTQLVRVTIGNVWETTVFGSTVVCYSCYEALDLFGGFFPCVPADSLEEN